VIVGQASNDPFRSHDTRVPFDPKVPETIVIFHERVHVKRDTENLQHLLHIPALICI
jgi:hypothetical protein